MLNRTDPRGQVPTASEPRATPTRAEQHAHAALHHVRPVVEAVRDRGVEAVLEYTEKFDKILAASVRVPRAKLTEALEQLNPQVRAALEESITRARMVHPDHQRTDKTVIV